jgi:uncharacterized membrane protein
MATTETKKPPVYRPSTLPVAYRVGTSAPIEWLKAGWDYFLRLKAVSLAYGAAFAAIGMAITWMGLTYPKFILTFWSGFLLVGPLLAVGLFRIAQQADRGDTIRLTACFRSILANAGNTALFILLLSIVMIAWIRFSTLAAALYIGNIVGAADFIAAMATPEGLGFLAVLFAVGGVFALIMFALTAWSLPMVLDNRVTFGLAIATSVKAVTDQPVPMLVWAAIVAGLTVIGMLTFFAAFAVIFPWLGYSTWAGYKAVFGETQSQ